MSYRCSCSSVKINALIITHMHDMTYSGPKFYRAWYSLFISLHMSSFKNDGENWSSQNWTSWTACYSHAKVNTFFVKSSTNSLSRAPLTNSLSSG